MDSSPGAGLTKVKPTKGTLLPTEVPSLLKALTSRASLPPAAPRTSVSEKLSKLLESSGPLTLGMNGGTTATRGY